MRKKHAERLDFAEAEPGICDGDTDEGSRNSHGRSEIFARLKAQHHKARFARQRRRHGSQRVGLRHGVRHADQKKNTGLLADLDSTFQKRTSANHASSHVFSEWKIGNFFRTNPSAVRRESCVQRATQVKGQERLGGSAINRGPVVAFFFCGCPSSSGTVGSRWIYVRCAEHLLQCEKQAPGTPRRAQRHQTSWQPNARGLLPYAEPVLSLHVLHPDRDNKNTSAAARERNPGVRSC